MAKTKTWKNPKTGRTLKVGQFLMVDAATRLGPASIGQFVITGFIDEGIIVKPTSDHGFGVQEIHVLPGDIV